MKSNDKITIDQGLLRCGQAMSTQLRFALKVKYVAFSKDNKDQENVLTDIEPETSFNSEDDLNQPEDTEEEDEISDDENPGLDGVTKRKIKKD